MYAHECESVCITNENMQILCLNMHAHVCLTLCTNVKVFTCAYARACPKSEEYLCADPKLQPIPETAFGKLWMIPSKVPNLEVAASMNTCSGNYDPFTGKFN